MKNKKVLYRYVERETGHSLFKTIELDLEEYIVCKETEKSYLINIFNNSPDWGYGNKWVLKTNPKSLKRFAYDTKEAALKNYILRKSKYIAILKDKLYSVEEGLKQAEKLRDKEFPDLKIEGKILRR